MTHSPSRTCTFSDDGFVFDGLQLYVPESDGLAPKMTNWLTVEDDESV
jgi:hypothetical protein